jgi:hypothetical protein
MSIVEQLETISSHTSKKATTEPVGWSRTTNNEVQLATLSADVQPGNWSSISQLVNPAWMQLN